MKQVNRETFNVAVWNDYHDMIAEKFFYVVNGRSVLEIAPYAGHQTQALVRQSPKKLTLVDANPDVADALFSQFPQAAILIDDIFTCYNSCMPADVVVCCGFLYHLHSPFYLLELIANRSDPDYIILDSITCKSMHCSKEFCNQPGTKFAPNGYRSIGLSVSVPFDMISAALDDLAYQCVEYQDLDQFRVETKENSWMALWKKK